MAKEAIGRGQARMPLRRRVETQDEGRHTVSWENDGERVGEVEVRVDVARLVALYGSRALGNKSRRAVAMNGCVEVVVLSERDWRASREENHARA